MYEKLSIFRLFYVINLVIVVMVYEHFADISRLLYRLQNGKTIMKPVNFLTENLKHAINGSELL